MRRDEVDAVIGQLLAAPGTIRSLLEAVPDEVLALEPAPGEWSIVQVVAHLLHADASAFRDRVRSIAGGADRLSPYDPTLDISVDGQARLVLHDLLERLTASRRESASLLRSIDPDLLERVASHPDGSFRAADFVEEWVYHDADHLQQILEIVKVHQLGRVGPDMRTALERMAEG